MAKRPTSRAAKPRAPATGRSAKPAAETRTKKSETKPAGEAKPVGTANAKSAKAPAVERQAPVVRRKANAAKDKAPAAKIEAPAAKIEAPAKVATKTRKAPVAAKPGSKPTIAASAPRSSAARKPTAKRQAAAKPPAKAGKPATPRKAAPRKRRPTPAYLAAELGQPLDHDGEPVGAGAALVAADRELQDYTLHLWRQMQSGRSINKHLQAVERAGLNLDDVWMVGVKETLKTTSSPEEAQLYRKKLLFRANLLEAILSETVSKLVRLDHRADVGGETEAS